MKLQIYVLNLLKCFNPHAG